MTPSNETGLRTQQSTASSPTGTQNQCQKENVFEKTWAAISTQRQTKQVHSIGHPSVHSIKPNQHTAPVPKEDVFEKSWAPISTQHHAKQLHSTAHPAGHSIKPNQYTAPEPKEDVFEKS